MADAEAPSFLVYSSIGFEKTNTEAFDDLKAEQNTISTKANRTRYIDIEKISKKTMSRYITKP